MKAGIRSIRTVMGAAFRVTPGGVLLATTLWVVSAITRPLFAIVLGLMVSAIERSAPASQVAWLAVGLSMTCGVGVVISEIAWKVVQGVQERASHELDRNMMQMVMRVPSIEHHEHPEYLDKLERLKEENWLLGEAVSMCLSTTSLVIQLVSSLVIFTAMDWRLAFLPIFAIPQVIFSIRTERSRFVVQERLQSEWRKSDDALMLITDPGSAKEIRVFGLGDEILRRHAASSRNSYKAEFEDRLKGAWLVVLGRLTFAVALGGSLSLIAVVAVENGGSPAKLITAASLSSAFMGQFAWVAGQIGWVSRSLSAIQSYLWLADFEKLHATPATRQSPSRLDHSITFDGLTFAYPGSSTPAIENLDLTIPAGSTVALIGDNGAGKSTLIKLLTRMYEPTAGRILIDDVPLGDIDPAAWRQHVSAAFQDHVRLEFVAGETVGVGNIEHASDAALLANAVDRGGATEVIDRLPSGFETQLGSAWDDGVDLSGGQWQKLALARGMMREPLLLVLDEPTSALDAETEHALFERFAGAARLRSSQTGTITVLVSHRFSTVRMADVIVVISGGKLVESGSHDQLMSAGGLYAELYELQARAYR